MKIIEPLIIDTYKAASNLRNVSDNNIKKTLLSLANLLASNSTILLKANAKDIAKQPIDNPNNDRLLLTQQRINNIAKSIRNISKLPNPSKKVLEKRTLANGLKLEKIAVPLGIVGAIFESRPNVTFDIAALCIRSQNGCLLKGSIDADETNKIAIPASTTQWGYNVQDIDVTNMVKWRERVKGDFEKREKEKITFTPLFIEAVCKAIKDFPMINISVDGTKIIIKKDINIGMATALPSGNLIVPVIKNADYLNLIGITKMVNDLANRARNNKLKPEEIQDGTFTITNVGTFGNVMGTPIINQPQVAILALGAIRKKPVVIETPEGDTIGIRQMMFLSLSYDHRVVDGSLGGSFLRRIADYLEQFDASRQI